MSLKTRVVKAAAIAAFRRNRGDSANTGIDVAALLNTALTHPVTLRFAQTAVDHLQELANDANTVVVVTGPSLRGRLARRAARYGLAALVASAVTLVATSDADQAKQLRETVKGSVKDTAQKISVPAFASR